MPEQDRRVDRAIAAGGAAPPATDAYLATLVRVSSEAIIGLAGDGTIQSWNAAAERIFGYTPGEVVGRSIALLAPPGYAPEQQGLMARLRAGDVVSLETVRRAKDGHDVPVQLNAAPVVDAGQLVLIAATLSDLTARQRAEVERQHLIALAEGSTDFIGMCDLAGIPFYLNQAGLELVGLESFAQAYHTPVQEFFFPEDQAYILETFLPAVLAQGHGEVEVRFRHFKTGAAVWMLYRVFALPDAHGQRVALATVSRDITARKQAEAALRASEARLQTALSIDTVGVIFFDLAGGIHDANAAFERMSGYGRTEFQRGRVRWDALTSPEFMAAALRARDELLTRGEHTPYEQQYTRPDGARWWGLVAGKRLSQDECVAFVLDITDRKQAEAAVRANEQVLRHLTRNIPGGSLNVFDHDLRYLFAAGQGLAQVGLSSAGLVGKRLAEVFPAESVASVTPYYRRAFAGEMVDFELEVAGRWYIIHTAPLRDGQGSINAVIALALDITERKEAEAAVAQALAAEQAARAEVEAALQTREQFLSIASHELRTPLTPLLGYTSMLQQSLAQTDGRQRKLVETIARQATRLNTLIGSLLDVSRLQRGQFALERRPLDLAALTTQVVDDSRLTLPPSGARHILTVEASDALVPVLADAERLEEVLHNLLGNAVKYSPQGGTVRVRVARQDGEALLEVADEGIGIPTAAQARLFEAFYRAGNIGPTTSGFGLGLYIVQEIVQRHGGRVEVDSSEGHGTTVRVVLPLQGEP